MRPKTFQEFVTDLAKNDGTTVRVQTLAEAGESRYTWGVAIATATGEARWQFVGQLPEGERHKEDGGEFEPVEGTPPPAGAAPQPGDEPEAWFAALIAQAECPQIASIERWSTREGSRSDHKGLTVAFHNTARIFARLT